MNTTTSTQIKLTRECAGSYTYTIRGVTFNIYQQKERDCSWYGEWIIEGNGGYSDPIRTLADCRAALADMENRADLYRIGVATNHPYPIDRDMMNPQPSIIEDTDKNVTYYRWEHKLTGEVIYSRGSIYSMGPFNPNYTITEIDRKEYEASK